MTRSSSTQHKAHKRQRRHATGPIKGHRSMKRSEKNSEGVHGKIRRTKEDMHFFKDEKDLDDYMKALMS